MSSKLETDKRVEADRRVQRCVEVLLDHHARQGGSLGIDDVCHLIARRQLTSDESLAVWESLSTEQIVVNGLDEVDEQEETPHETSMFDVRGSSDSIESHSWPSLYGSHELLSREEEIQLGRRILSARAASVADPDGLSSDVRERLVEVGELAHSRLILANIRLVIHCAKLHSRQSLLPLDDLVQEGILGLLRAVELYDPERGFKFSTYATWWINQSISRSTDQNARTIRIPRHMLDRLRQMRREQKKLGASLGRLPTAGELASELRCDAAEVRVLRKIEHDAFSLDKELDDSGSNRLRERLPSPGDSPLREVERNEMQRLVGKALTTLDERSRQIVTLRFGLDGRMPKTLEQIGGTYGISCERVRQIEKQALGRIAHGGRTRLLREYAEKDPSKGKRHGKS